MLPLMSDGVCDSVTAPACCSVPAALLAVVASECAGNPHTPIVMHDLLLSGDIVSTMVTIPREVGGKSKTKREQRHETSQGKREEKRKTTNYYYCNSLVYTPRVPIAETRTKGRGEEGEASKEKEGMKTKQQTTS
jgi:hypothetical protein